MYPLFETICVTQGRVAHPEYHHKRFWASYTQFYGTAPSFGLFDAVTLPSLEEGGLYKLRVEYNKKGTRHTLEKYQRKRTAHLKLVFDDHIDYGLKYNDRRRLNDLFALRGQADDILIVRKGLITDGSYANLLLTDGRQVYTPKHPLLKGCCRERLLDKGGVRAKDIAVGDLGDFKGFQLINAMNDYDPNRWLPIQNIVR
ncbi:aminotransferase class IV [Maribacter sp. 2307ULW6-5]|uniref:aminotransferase class IV n=1 Tax=Maribacter sp. 2307ULW6-5 TaxID=3386275 RepID=UPI0039BD3AA0